MYRTAHSIKTLNFNYQNFKIVITIVPTLLYFMVAVESIIYNFKILMSCVISGLVLCIPLYLDLHEDGD